MEKLYFLKVWREWGYGKAVLRRFVDTFCSNFQKNGPTDFQKSRKALILCALESYDPGASNGVSNVEI